MRRHFFAFFVISLLSELGTTLLQRQRTVTDVYPGLYYPDFNTLLAERLLFWFVIFAAAQWSVVLDIKTLTTKVERIESHLLWKVAPEYNGRA